jgi:hypothetical protein
MLAEGIQEADARLDPQRPGLAVDGQRDRLSDESTLGR